MQLFAVKKGTAPGLSTRELGTVQDSQWQSWEGRKDPSLLAAPEWEVLEPAQAQEPMSPVCAVLLQEMMS